MVNCNVKFTLVFGGHSLINNTYYEIRVFLLIFPGNLSILFRPSLIGDYHWTAILHVNLYGHFSVLSIVGGGLWGGSLLCRSYTVYLRFH